MTAGTGIMKIFRSLNEIKYDQNSVVSVGIFDGVHVGHQSIIKEMSACALASGARSVIVTFDPHPREIVGKGPVSLLSTLDERLGQMDANGVEVVLVIDFTYEFSRKNASEFYRDYIISGIGVMEVIVGSDHMFGRDRESNIQEVRRLGLEHRFKVNVIDPVSTKGVVVSSTKIRNLLLEGEVEIAGICLNRPYELKGRVVSGDRRGEELGFPTANIRPLSEKKLIPADGVYFVSVGVEGRSLYGMLNIGIRPTFRVGSDRSIEVNIFDLGGKLYDKEVTLHFLKRIRPEKRFSSKDELIEQLKSDRSLCMRFVNEI